MKISIEDANSDFSNCGHLLSISSLKTFDIRVTNIVSIEAGYRKKDKIVGLKLNRSLKEDDFYLFNINDKISLIKDDKLFESFIERLEESSGFTVVYIYSSIDNLAVFFGPLIVKSFDCVFNYGNSIQYAEVNDCSLPAFEIKGVNTSSAIIVINDNSYSFLKYSIRYRRIGVLNWTYIETQSLKNGINSLESSTTYEVQIMKYCTNNKNTNYSNSQVFATYSI